MTDPDWLSDFVKLRMAEEAAEGSAFAEAQGMLLYGTIGHEAYLRPDGSVWYHGAIDWVKDPDAWEWREADRLTRWGAFVIASQRFPELRKLLPIRPEPVPDCTRCNGTGDVFKGVQCPDCHGLGWVPGEAV